MNLRLAQTRSQFHFFDDSRLARIKANLDDIRDQMRAQQTASELEGQFLNDLIPVATKVTQSKDQLIKDVETYLGDGQADRSFAAQQKP